LLWLDFDMILQCFGCELEFDSLTKIEGGI